MSKVLNKSVKHTLKISDINTTIWQENGKVKQSGQTDLPEYLAEFNDTYEGRKQAEVYIAGMLRLSELLNSRAKDPLFDKYI